MKKNILILLILMLWASRATAEQAQDAVPSSAVPTVETELAESSAEFDAKAGLGYWYVQKDRNTRAGEYEYLKSSVAGALDLEWDPLPHRFLLESSFLNRKDYYDSTDYSYRDVVFFNMYTRGMFHNLDHYRFGTDDPTTLSPSFTDRNPGDEYGIENQLRRAFIRFKTPDFPFHLYAEVKTIDREGTVQQRFMRGFTGGLDKVSQSRNIDWNSQEVTVGANSHLGPVEADYSHTEKKLSVITDKVLIDSYTMPAMDVQHNLVPSLKSSSDTIKIHTAYNGRVTASGTYSNGQKENQDSGAKSDYRNLAGDLVVTPVAGTLLILKYRHYELSTNNPDTVTISSLGNTYTVRDSLASTRDLLTGVVRYRATPRLTVKGEYVFDMVVRDAFHGDSLTPLQIAPVQSGTRPDFWDVSHRTIKGTAKLGTSYRAMNKLTLRADYSAMQVTNPAYTMDPDRVDSANASAVWTPVQRVTIMLSYGGAREKRDNLSAPLAGGSRKTDRDQILGSLTVLVGKRSSVTASYLYFKNKTAQTFTYQDALGMFSLESGVPYADTAQVASLSATHALDERIQLTAEASRSFSKGSFRNDGSTPNTTGIAEFSDLRVVENIYSAGMQMQVSKTLGGELRYQQRHYDDKIDNTLDGKVSTVLAAVSVKW